MSTRELLELTILDSLGLLEPHEQEGFEREFARAPESIREQVRREQSRLADLTDLLPDVEPRDELRDRVLAAVREAIGTRQPTPAVRHAPGRVAPRLSRGPRVSWVWRSSAIAMAVIVAILGVSITQIQMDFNTLNNETQLAQLHNRIGPEYVHDLLLDPNTELIHMLPVGNDESQAAATVVINPDWNIARVYHLNVGAQEQGDYRLVVLDDADNVVGEIASFHADGRFSTLEAPLEHIRDGRLGITRVSGSGPDRLVLRQTVGTT
ncbi:MAG: hypothetical protein R3B57_03895 [Phycisphaerales bacterium]